MNSGNGTDNFGFSALPGGSLYAGSSFGIAGYIGVWWSASEYGSGRAYHRTMGSGDGLVEEGNERKGNGLSVLCVQ